MKKIIVVRLIFVAFSLLIAALILTKTLEIPIAIVLWVVGMVIFRRERKRNKSEMD